MSRLLYQTPEPGSTPVEISYIRTKSIDREPQYNPADQTEYLYTKVTVHVEGLINAALLPSAHGETAAETLQRIGHLLETPRGQLTFFIGLDVYIQSPVRLGQTDAKLGPYPQVLSITQIGGTQSIQVSYKVVTYIVECPPGLVAPSYASWRFRTTEAIDERWATKLTTSGTIICRADLKTNPDALRGIVAPPIPDGFRRLSAEYTLQEDGLAMSYTFVDQEQYLQPPFPSIEATGSYTESTSNGAQRFGEVRVRLKGPLRNIDKGDLLRLCILICVQKLQTAGAAVAVKGQFPQAFLAMGAIHEELYEPTIELRYRAKLGKLTGRVAGMNVDLKRFAMPPAGSGKTDPTDFGVRGTAGLTMISQALQDPCIQAFSVLRTGALPSNNNPTSGESPVAAAVVYLTPVLPNDQAAKVELVRGGVGGAALVEPPGVYDHYDCESWYRFPQHVYQLPVAGNDGETECAFVQLAAPTAQLIVEYSATKTGSRPTLPEDIEDNNLVLLHSDIKPMMVDLESDGVTVNYRTRGRLIYGLKKASKADVQHPVPPWMDPVKAGADARLQPGDFRQNILNPAKAGGGGGGGNIINKIGNPAGGGGGAGGGQGGDGNIPPADNQGDGGANSDIQGF